VRAGATNQEGHVNNSNQEDSKEWEAEINEPKIEENKEAPIVEAPYDDMD
tara:strand:- start:332 stop:481 length:150 start_codon:yes stop_codon:yes gene_type:complete